MKDNYFDNEYFATYKEQWLNVIDFDSEAARIYEVLNKPKSVMDFGCGQGHFVKSMSMLTDCRGCDISNSAIATTVADKGLTHVKTINEQVYGEPIDYEVAYFYGSLHYLPIADLLGVMKVLSKSVSKIFIGDIPYSEMSIKHLNDFKEYFDKTFPITVMSYETFTTFMGNLGFFCEYVNWVEDMGTGKNVPHEVLFIKK